MRILIHQRVQIFPRQTFQFSWHFSGHNHKQSDYNMTDGKTRQRRKRLRYQSQLSIAWQHCVITDLINLHSLS